MADVITLLALSPTMEEGTIAEWLKAEGDSVEEGEIIAEVETDKATMEMESFFEGTVLRVLVSAGDVVPVGAPLAVVGEAGEDADAALAALGGAADGSVADEAAPAPREDAHRAEDAGYGGHDEAARDAREGEARERAATPAQTDGRPAPAEGGRIFASPIARRMAQEAGIALERIEGSGPNGRIVKQDVERAQASGRSDAPVEAAPGAPRQAAPGAPAVVGQLPDAGGHPEPMSQMRRTIARRLTQVWQNTPFFYLTVEIDMSAAMARRSAVNAEIAAAGVEAKLSVNDMIVKACASALRSYPRMNVAFNGDELVHFDRVHVGIAVALEDGLITPVLKDADRMGLRAISQNTRELATRARDKKLKPEEYTGSTFSISNLGMYGVDNFLAVINPPEAAILACGAVQKVPVVGPDGELTVGTRMKITLTCDHRAVDGAVGAEFLQHVRRGLENPVLLMI